MARLFFSPFFPLPPRAEGPLREVTVFRGAWKAEVSFFLVATLPIPLQLALAVVEEESRASHRGGLLFVFLHGPDPRIFFPGDERCGVHDEGERGRVEAKRKE